jgi:hypothetical protein
MTSLNRDLLNGLKLNKVVSENAKKKAAALGRPIPVVEESKNAATLAKINELQAEIDNLKNELK